MIKWWFFSIFFLVPTASFAYLGPGMGGGAIAAILGIIAASLLAIGSIVYFPIKRALKNKKRKDQIKKDK